MGVRNWRRKAQETEIWKGIVEEAKAQLGLWSWNENEYDDDDDDDDKYIKCMYNGLQKEWADSWWLQI